VERLSTGDRVLSAFDLGKKGEIVALEGTTDRPKEIALLQAGGAWRPITKVNEDALMGVTLGKVTRHEAKSADGTVIDYYLTRPPEAPAGKLPAILRIHGGPVAQFQNEFAFEWQLFGAAVSPSPGPSGPSGGAKTSTTSWPRSTAPSPWARPIPTGWGWGAGATAAS
jgi:dipeptidyl aminopeptidase/acylaminoacyl peptidase